MVQTGHYDSQPLSFTADGDNTEANAQAGAGDLPLWFARSSYVPLRKMYDNRPIRPVMDLEPHYENTHHFFNVSNLVAMSS